MPILTEPRAQSMYSRDISEPITPIWAATGRNAEFSQTQKKRTYPPPLSRSGPVLALRETKNQYLVMGVTKTSTASIPHYTPFNGAPQREQSRTPAQVQNVTAKYMSEARETKEMSSVTPFGVHSQQAASVTKRVDSSPPPIRAIPLPPPPPPPLESRLFSPQQLSAISTSEPADVNAPRVCGGIILPPYANRRQRIRLKSISIASRTEKAKLATAPPEKLPDIQTVALITGLLSDRRPVSPNVLRVRPATSPGKRKHSHPPPTARSDLVRLRTTGRLIGTPSVVMFPHLKKEMASTKNRTSDHSPAREAAHRTHDAEELVHRIRMPVEEPEEVLERIGAFESSHQIRQEAAQAGICVDPLEPTTLLRKADVTLANWIRRATFKQRLLGIPAAKSLLTHGSPPKAHEKEGETSNISNANTPTSATTSDYPSQANVPPLQLLQNDSDNGTTAAVSQSPQARQNNSDSPKLPCSMFRIVSPPSLRLNSARYRGSKTASAHETPLSRSGISPRPSSRQSGQTANQEPLDEAGDLKFGNPASPVFSNRSARSPPPTARSAASRSVTPPRRTATALTPSERGAGNNSAQPEHDTADVQTTPRIQTPSHLHRTPRERAVATPRESRPPQRTPRTPTGPRQTAASASTPRQRPSSAASTSANADRPTTPSQQRQQRQQQQPGPHGHQALGSGRSRPNTPAGSRPTTPARPGSAQHRPPSRGHGAKATHRAGRGEQGKISECDSNTETKVEVSDESKGGAQSRPEHSLDSKEPSSMHEQSQEQQPSECEAGGISHTAKVASSPSSFVLSADEMEQVMALADAVQPEDPGIFATNPFFQSVVYPSLWKLAIVALPDLPLTHTALLTVWTMKPVPNGTDMQIEPVYQDVVRWSETDSGPMDDAKGLLRTLDNAFVVRPADIRRGLTYTMLLSVFDSAGDAATLKLHARYAACVHSSTIHLQTQTSHGSALKFPVVRVSSGDSPTTLYELELSPFSTEGKHLSGTRLLAIMRVEIAKTAQTLEAALVQALDEAVLALYSSEEGTSSESSAQRAHAAVDTLLALCDRPKLWALLQTVRQALPNSSNLNTPSLAQNETVGELRSLLLGSTEFNSETVINSLSSLVGRIRYP